MRRGRSSLVVATVLVWLAMAAMSAAPAWADNIDWTGHLLRTQPQSSTDVGLELVASSDAPSYGVLFSLNLSGFTISNVVSSPAGCIATPASPVSHYAYQGIDCSFNTPATDLTVTFDTTPRYPDLAGGSIADDNQSMGLPSPVGGPAGEGFIPLGPSKDDLKSEVRQDAYLNWANAVMECGAISNTASFPGSPGIALLLSQSPQQCAQAALQAYQNEVANADPPDARYLSVAVSTPPLRVHLGARCSKVPAHLRTICRRVAPMEAQLITDDSATAAILAAVTTTMNRGNTALTASNATGEELQLAALRAYDGELVSLLKAEDATSKKLAFALTGAQIFPSMTEAQVTREEDNLAHGELPKGVHVKGVSKAAFAAAIQAGFASIHLPALTFDMVFENPQATGPSFTQVDKDYKSMTGEDVKALIEGLAHGHATSGHTATKLTAALAKVLASHGSARKHARASYLHDLTKLPGPVGMLLSTASAPVIG